MKFDNYEDYEETQLHAGSLENDSEHWTKGQINSLDIFLLPLLNKESSVIDVGCGAGIGIKHLISKGIVNVIGIDMNQDKLNVAKKIVDKDVFIKSSATDLPFNNNTFDVVWCSHALEHILNPIKALKEFSRVCKPSGYILIIVPYPDVDSEIHCNISELKLDIDDRGDSCVQYLEKNNFIVSQYYPMNIREPELFIKIKNKK